MSKPSKSKKSKQPVLVLDPSTGATVLVPHDHPLAKRVGASRPGAVPPEEAPAVGPQRMAPTSYDTRYGARVPAGGRER